VEKRGHNETEQKLHEEQEILAATEKGGQRTAGDAPKQQGNVAQHPAEKPREPGPTAELPTPDAPKPAT